MSNGMRMYGKEPLTEDEIAIVKQAIKEIQADETIFVFNDPQHMSSTCYSSVADVVYIGRNIFPDTKYGSTHPRDLMSIRAVLAHEYYGHRPYRQEYLSDEKNQKVTTPEWQDECRASITAAQTAPGLSHMDRYHLVQDAVKRAEEYGQWIKTDDFMKEVLYGYSSDGERGIATRPPVIQYIRATSENGNDRNRRSKSNLPKVSNKTRGNNNGFVR